MAIVNTSYFVSSDGSIINIKTLKVLKESTAKSRSGKKYSIIRLWDYDKHKMVSHYVHRLVALFYCNDKGYVVLGRLNEVNHIDGNTRNNHYTNLEIVTASENQKHWRETKKEKKECF